MVQGYNMATCQGGHLLPVEHHELYQLILLIKTQLYPCHKENSFKTRDAHTPSKCWNGDGFSPSGWLFQRTPGIWKHRPELTPAGMLSRGRLKHHPIAPLRAWGNWRIKEGGNWLRFTSNPFLCRTHATVFQIWMKSRLSSWGSLPVYSSGLSPSVFHPDTLQSGLQANHLTFSDFCVCACVGAGGDSEF